MHAEHSRAAVCALRAAARGAPTGGVHAVAARSQDATLWPPLQNTRERARAKSGPGVLSEHT